MRLRSVNMAPYPRFTSGVGERCVLVIARKLPYMNYSQAPDVFRARWETDAGPFVIEVTRSFAPKSADRFYNLLKRGFYDDQRFFRVVPKYIQWGIHANADVNHKFYRCGFFEHPVAVCGTVHTPMHML